MIGTLINERYKIEQQYIEQQREFVKTVQAGILSLIERNSSKLKELSAHRVFSGKDYLGIHDLISENLEGKSLFGHIVICDGNGSCWLPGFQAYPPSTKTLSVPEEWIDRQSELDIAERAEFRRRDYPEAISLYQRIFDRAGDKQVKAWMLNRIARCDLDAVRLRRGDDPLVFVEPGLSDLIECLEGGLLQSHDRGYGLSCQ